MKQVILITYKLLLEQKYWHMNLKWKNEKKRDETVSKINKEVSMEQVDQFFIHWKSKELIQRHFRKDSSNKTKKPFL